LYFCCRRDGFRKKKRMVGRGQENGKQEREMEKDHAMHVMFQH